MSIRYKFTAAVIAASFILPVTSLHLYAAESAKPAVSATTQKEDNEMIKTSEDAHNAFRDLRAARLAIFNGYIEQANQLMHQAEASLEKARSMQDILSVQTNHALPNSGAYIPVDVSLALSESFVPTKEKESVIQKVNQFLFKKDRKRAVDALKAANIDVMVSTALLPIDASLENIKQATTLFEQKKFYEANLALKAVEDSIIVENYNTDNIPVQGSKKN